MRGSGPALLLIAGGTTDAAIFDGIAIELAGRYTVLAHDPRGSSRSPLEGPPVDQRIDVHADDAHRILDRFVEGPAYVFGSSSGALVSLELLARHPGQTARVVAHEPPAVELLPDAEPYRLFFAGVLDTYRREGAGPAMRAFAVGAGIEAQPRARPMPREGIDLRARMSANSEFFLEHEMMAFASFVPDLMALEPVAARLVMGIGRDSLERFPSMPAAVIARRLGIAVAEFPGGHMGYAAHPVDFAARLHEELSAPAASADLEYPDLD